MLYPTTMSPSTLLEKRFFRHILKTRSSKKSSINGEDEPKMAEYRNLGKSGLRVSNPIVSPVHRTLFAVSKTEAPRSQFGGMAFGDPGWSVSQSWIPPELAYN